MTVGQADREPRWGPSAQAPQTDAFDPAATLARLDGNWPLFVELVELFLEDAPLLLGEIEQALAQGDAERLWRAAHTLRGAIGNFSISAAYETARKLESMGRSADLRDGQGVLKVLQAGVAHLAAALKQFMSESTR